MSAYDDAVLALSPVAYLKLDETSGTTAADSSGNGLNGSYVSAPELASAVTPLGSPAVVFNGVDEYVQVADNDGFSVTDTGELTVMALIRPDSLAMPNTEGSGYVHFIGKGASNQFEWAFRMYQDGNSDGRENRLAFYVFNLAGNLGVGESLQVPLIAGKWIHLTGTLNEATKRIEFYRDGVLADDGSYFGNGAFVDVTPENGTAPLRAGTRNVSSMFNGAISNLAIFPTALTAAQILALAELSMIPYRRQGRIQNRRLGRR